MTEPDAEPEKRTKSRRGCGCLGLLLLFVGYILSPPILVLGTESLPEGVQPAVTSVLITFYSPLAWLMIKVLSIREFYDWYYGLFGI